MITLTGCALPPRVARQLDADLRRCSELRGGQIAEPEASVHRALFGTSRVDGVAYRAYFDRSVREIRGEGWLSSSCHGALACMDRSGTLRLSSDYADLETIPPLIRISLLLHEARHAQGWEHEACSEQAPESSPYQGASLRARRACDPTDEGANGTQLHWLRAIAASCENCSDRERKQALDYTRFLAQLIGRKR